MAKLTPVFSKEQRIQQLVDCCESIKANAADYIGNEEYSRGLTVSIVMECREFPYIKLERECLPSAAINRLI